MASYNSGSVTYTYDGDGRRVKKSNGKLYWYGINGQVLEETDLSGTLITDYVYFGGTRIARRDANGTMYYFLADRLGNARVITDSTGSVQEESDYYSYGQERVVTGNGALNNYKFTGHERDTESSLDHTLYRQYASNLGRWLSPDRARGDPTKPQSWNRYAYTLGDPTNHIDQDGGFCLTAWDLEFCTDPFWEDDYWDDDLDSFYNPDICPVGTGLLVSRIDGFDCPTSIAIMLGGIFLPTQPEEEPTQAIPLLWGVKVVEYCYEPPGQDRGKVVAPKAQITYQPVDASLDPFSLRGNDLLEIFETLDPHWGEENLPKKREGKWPIGSVYGVANTFTDHIGAQTTYGFWLTQTFHYSLNRKYALPEAGNLLIFGFGTDPEGLPSNEVNATRRGVRINNWAPREICGQR